MSNLAIHGGDPVAPDGLATDWPRFGDAEREALLEVLDRGTWCAAPYLFDDRRTSTVARFEDAWAEYIGTDHATAVPNGTQALELAFRAIGLDPGDEVIVPAVTFIASATAVVLANGVPRFVDVDPDTYQLDPAAVEDAITDRTAAIEVVHYGGYPAEMDALREIADEHDLYLVEDAAEAHGTAWRGQRVGSLGDVGCFSFQQGKALSCGEGGAVTYNDSTLGDRIHSYARLGRTPDGGRYEHRVPAGNFRLSEFLGGLLLAQLDRLPAQTAVRAENGRRLADRVEQIAGLSTLPDDARITDRGYYFYFLKFDPVAWPVERDSFREALGAEGIPCHTAHNDPVYTHPAFESIDERLLYDNPIDYGTVSCPVAERIYETEVVALSKDFLLDAHNVELVATALEKLAANRDDLAA